MAWSFVLDGEDITSIALDKEATRELNAGPSTAKCRIPSHLLADISGFAEGTSRLKVYDDSSALWHHGIVWFVSDDGDENTVYTEIHSADPKFIWPMRPARDADGDFSYPSFLTTQNDGPAIMRYILDNSETWEGDLLLDTGGTLETGGVSLAGTPLDYPVTLMEVHNQLVGSGQLDVVLAPVETGTDLARVDLYNGGHGADLSGSVVFQYATGANNVRRVRLTRSMAQMCNKLYYYLGPKKATADDPDAAQHWRSNVTGDHPALANPPGGDVDYSNPLGDLVNASRAAYWTSMDIRTYDSAVDSGTDAETAQLGTDALYLRLWQAELAARVNARVMLVITPVRGTEPSFDVHDLVGFELGSKVRGGLEGAMRVHKIKVNIDNNGVVDLGELVTSADGEGA